MDEAQVDWQAEFSSTRSPLAAIIRNIVDPVVLADDTGHLVAANPAAERLLGHDPGGLVGVALTDVVVPSAAPRMGLPEFVAAGRGEQVVELQHREGTTIEVEARSVANVVDGIHLSVWRDLGPYQRAQRELAESRARLGAVVRGASVGLLLVADDDTIELCNPAAATVLGTDVTGIDVTAVLASLTGDLDSAANVLQAATATPREEQLVATHDDRHLRLLVTPVGGKSRILHVEDVTARQTVETQLRSALDRERHASEELTQLSHLKDTFLSAVSHELRTPLTAIHGFAATLEAHLGVLEPEQVENLLHRLRMNAMRLDGLLDNLLDLDRLRRGVQVVQQSDTRLVEAIEGGLTSIDLSTHSLRLDVDDVSCRLDRPKVERIIENLAANATRHTPPGTTVRIRAHQPDDVVLLVEDDGPGVPEDIRDRVFDMFAKGESPEARAAGTGVGLALVREFVDLMGGTIELTTSELGGAAFEVRIPV